MPKVFLVRKKSVGSEKLGRSHYRKNDLFPCKLFFDWTLGSSDVPSFFHYQNSKNQFPNHTKRYSTVSDWCRSFSDDSHSNVTTSPSTSSSISSPTFHFTPQFCSLNQQCIHCKEFNPSKDLKCNPCTKKGNTEIRLSEKPFTCSVCGKGFRLSSTLCRHKIIHTTQRPHKCNICEKSFNRSSTLKTHLRTHNQKKEFLCHVCNKGFHQKGNLRNHILIHTGEKPYCCEVCNKSFNKLSNLKFHIHSHTDQKPYRCRFCKLAMARRGELKDHLATYHSEDF